MATLFFYPELDEMSKLDGGMIEFDDHKVFTPISLSSSLSRLLQDQIRLSLFNIPVYLQKLGPGFESWQSPAGFFSKRENR